MKKHLTLVYSNLLWGESLSSLLNENTEFKVLRLIKLRSIPEIEYLDTSIFILEASSPNAELVEHVKYLKKKKQKVIVVGFVLDNQLVDIIIQEGIDGYVLKSDSKENLFLSINQVAKDEKFFSANVTQILSNHLQHSENDSKLTKRELDVLIGIVNMQQTKEIADQLHLSQATVRTHRKHIMQKFGAKNYIGLIRYACRNGLLESPGEQFCLGCKNLTCSYPHFG